MADHKQRAHQKYKKKHTYNRHHGSRQYYEQSEIKRISSQCSQEISTDTIDDFTDFPLSKRTISGLNAAGFTKPTEIQKDSIALALRGLDVLGAAKTGSGKTLAFLIPVLELLWRNKWTNVAGLGAIIISPTRELALQTYEVLRKVGQEHDFSAGLIIGGKDIDSEKDRILNTNIIICTPGRLLQHFDETPNFHCNDLKILVLDEADRILDLGFSQTMNAIIENLPDTRQTLLFSATQTKSVKDLARLSLKDPQYISVHENSKYSTPKKLLQNYAVVELQDKINFLFSFVKNHLKSKSIVFLSSCKQVKFIYEVFRKIRPGVPLMALYGKQKQLKRVGIYNKFCGTKHALLFATDIAARGLDFPAVNWVLQFDCPENVDTYIHRAGRTARYEKGGQALLLLLPSETAMAEKLQERKIPIHEIKANPKKIRSIQGKLQAFCAQDQEIKHWAQRSIVSYARSVYLQKEKSIFDVNKLQLDEFATSCGLLAPPKVRFMNKLKKQIGPSEGASNSLEKTSSKKNVGKLGIERLHSKDSDDEMFNTSGDDDDDDDDDDVLVKKTGDLNHDKLGDLHDIDEEKEKESKKRIKVPTKASLAKKVLRKNIKLNTRVTFDEQGEEVSTAIDDNDDEADEEDITSTEGGIDVEKAKLRMKTQDRIDREKERKRIKEKHREIKRKERAERQADAVGGVAFLGDENDEEYPDEELDKVTEGNEEEEEEEDDDERRHERSYKRRKLERTKSKRETKQVEVRDPLLEDEELALHLLGASS